MVAFADTYKFEALSEPFSFGSAPAVAAEDDGAVAGRYLSAYAVCAEKQGKAIFTGYIADIETGLMFAHTRYYSGILGRYISRHPLTGVNPMERPEIKNVLPKIWIVIASQFVSNANGGYIQSRFGLYDYCKSDPVNRVEPFSPGPLVGVEVGGGVVAGEVIFGTTLLTGASDVLMWWLIVGTASDLAIEARGRGKSDPYTLPEVDVGLAPCGKCNPCPPNGAIFRASKPGHGVGSNSCHQIIYDQTPGCVCKPRRIDLPCPPGTP